MSIIAKAVWYIESHFADPITLDDVSKVAGVSRFHMSRVFAVTTGVSIQGYIRNRRLSEAAKHLANGAPDILAVALDAGYNSHEAFTRAFRSQFGVTPEKLRSEGLTLSIKLVEPMHMKQSNEISKLVPRFVEGKLLLLAGLSKRYADNKSMPLQWQNFFPYIGSIPNQVGKKAYGVLYNSDDAGMVDYMSGVEVEDFSELPSELSALRIPEQYYAVFPHSEHVSSINKTWMTVFNEWIPSSSYELADGPQFERYSEDFDTGKGIGAMEIWVPVKK